MNKSNTFLLFFSVIIFSVLNVNAQDSRAIKNFHAVASSGAYEVHIKMSDKESLRIEGNEEDLGRIETVVQNGLLKIRTKRNINNWNIPVNVVKIYITAIKLDGLMQSGSGTIEVEGDLNSASADIQLSGSGQIKAGLKTQSASINLSGSGNIVLDGKVGDLNVTLTGSGDVNADKLIAENVKVKLAGNGFAYVYAESELEAAIVGSGEVKYLGNPNITTSKLGTGKVSKM